MGLHSYNITTCASEFFPAATSDSRSPARLLEAVLVVPQVAYVVAAAVVVLRAEHSVLEFWCQWKQGTTGTLDEQSAVNRFSAGLHSLLH